MDPVLARGLGQAPAEMLGVDEPAFWRETIERRVIKASA